MLSPVPLPARENGSVSDWEPPLKKKEVKEELKSMDVEGEESDDDDWDLSKFGRLDPLPLSLLEPCKGVKTFTRENIHEFDLEKELFTPDSPGDILGDRACWKRYFQQIDQSEGFDIKDFPGYGPMTTIHPISPSEDIKGYAAQALELYNEDNGIKYEVNEILKVNRACTGYFSFYITFTVTNGNGEMEYFQALVDEDVDCTLECAIIRPRAKGGLDI